MTDQSPKPGDKQEYQLEAPPSQPDLPRDDAATSSEDGVKTPDDDATDQIVSEGLAQDSALKLDGDGGKEEIAKGADGGVSGRPSPSDEDQAQHLEENEDKKEEKKEDGVKEEAEVEKEEDKEDEEEGGEDDGDEEEESEDDDEEEDDDEDEDEDEDDEPRLKYARLTQHLGPLYRNGDATSAFLVAGDKMIVGTHNGNINIIQLPMFQSLKVYHAHSASVTGISISPFPPPLPTDKPEVPQRVTAPAASSSASARPLDSSPAAASRKPRERPQIPKTPSNDIFVATSSMDGNVCVQSLIDMKDVQLRNFARPVQTVALSPEYRTDRTYLSGGTAGQLILTVGGAPGRSTSTTTGSAAAAASGWLGSMGIGSNTGKDTILHSGEGIISTIKWSLSGKYVVWLNEHGIKIMRSKLHLDSADTEDAWKRIGHIDRPQTEEWDTMASVWKGRVEWIDEQSVESDESEQGPLDKVLSPATEKLKEQAILGKKSIERLLVGWGGTIWIIHVHPGGVGVGRNVGEKSLGRAEIVKILRMDCIISGISLYTQNLLLVLAYCLPDDDDEGESVEGSPAKTHKSQPSTASRGSETAGGIRRRQNNQPPELRLIDLNSQAEADKDGLSVSRYERLSSGDYHLGVLPARNAASAVASSKGALEALAGLGSDMWNAAINPRSLFSSGASIRSRESGEDANSSMRGSTTGTIRPGTSRNSTPSVHPGLVKPGVKIFIHSPYDCILATRRDLGDHLAWLLERQQYQRAWELLDDHPEIVMTASEKASDAAPQTPSKQQENADDYDDDESTADSAPKSGYASVDREKRRIGELWIQELIEENDWISAGQVCGRVLTTADRWEKWVWTFAGAKRLDEITDYIPTEPMHPPIPTTIYEVVLGHYLQTDKPRFRELLDRWPTDLFDIKTITTVLENQLKYRDVRETSIDDGEKGRDWRIVMESLARLHEANGRHREALKCYIKLHDADSAFRLIRDNHLADAVADDIPSFIGLRVSPEDVSVMTEADLEHATSEAITLLVDEAQHGLLRPDVVVEQLTAQQLNLYIYFYFRGLWKGEGIKEHVGENVDRLVMDSQSLVDGFGDLAVHLFATYDRPLLMEFLKISVGYTYEKAVQECELFSYYDELVYLYSKTGEMKRALFLIIDRLKNVGKAIEFAKEQDDPDLWEDLLNYSMDKPSFIRGLLEQVGTAINPITLVRRIPEGLEIEGLREGLTHMMKEHEIQYSISSGVARVLRSEVAAAQNELRSGQRKAIKFEISVHSTEHVDVEVKDITQNGTHPIQS
ncbi:Vacuolar protein sorting-associated protein 41 [Neonectria punicea]|uniref:Vacuolar protein sorting-associated protein 41 n=1 Tax=Neonectria punicea TaxID=979145 RepID=A0ABR1HLH6_9HYPO